MQVKEYWKPIKGFFGCYEVSTEGRVRSFLLRKERRNIGELRADTPKILCPNFRKGSTGYYYVHLTGPDGSARRYLHHLILETFVGPRPKGLQAGHIDGDSKNNRPSNLVWVTAKENHRHLTESGKRVGNRKLKEKQVNEIRKLLSKNIPQRWIADKFKVTQGNISRIKLGKSWGV